MADPEVRITRRLFNRWITPPTVRGIPVSDVDQIFSISVEVQDILSSHAWLMDFGNEISDMGFWDDVLLGIAEFILVPSIRTNFEVGGRFGGVPWPPLAESTVRKWRTMGFKRRRDRPLVARGRFKQVAASKERFNVYMGVMHYGFFPPTFWWAPIHDVGSRAWAGFPGLMPSDDIGEIMAAVMSGRKAALIPARPYAVIQEEDIKDIQQYVWEAIRLYLTGRHNRYF